MATATKNGAKKNGAKPRPIFAKSYFPVQVAVFEHSNEGRTNYSIKLTRSFKRDEESSWETTEYLSAQDLLPAARLLGDAYEAIQARQDESYRERHKVGEGRDDQF
jgi:hypothetical protein